MIVTPALEILASLSYSDEAILFFEKEFMVLLRSLQSPADFVCPEFSLVSVDDKVYSLADFAGSKALLVAFICSHCPYVAAIEGRLLALRRRFALKELAMVGICANDPQKYPADAKAELLKLWREKNYGFPYLVDDSQKVARAFDAVCTPDLFLFDEKRKLYYRGRLDDNWQEESSVKKHELADAIDALLADRPAPSEQHPSLGCSIKWRD